MKTKTIIKIAILMLGIQLLSSNITAITINTVKENTNTDPEIEIFDISYGKFEINAVIHSNTLSARTLVINFYVSTILGGIETEPIFVGQDIKGININQTIEASTIWVGFGHHMIYVEIYGTIASKEIWIPTTKPFTIFKNEGFFPFLKIVNNLNISNKLGM